MGKGLVWYKPQCTTEVSPKPQKRLILRLKPMTTAWTEGTCHLTKVQSLEYNQIKFITIFFDTF